MHDEGNQPTLLSAELVVEPAFGRAEELTARGALLNTSADPLEINLDALSSPSLALEIVDAEGSPVLLPPPPVPQATPSRAELAPGGRHTVEYRGFVPHWTPSGSYRTRLRYVDGHRRIFADWVDFTLSA
jgi:hypothetical protein